MRRPERGDVEHGDGSISVAVIETIADAEGVDPIELDTPLHEAIDPRALERLVASPSSVQSVRFDYLDWTVEVRPDEGIQLEKRP